MTDTTSPITATVQGITPPTFDASGNQIPGYVSVLADGATVAIPASPLSDMGLRANDRVLVQSYVSGSNTPPRTYIIGRAGSTMPTASLTYYERYVLMGFTTNGAVNGSINWQTCQTSGLLSGSTQVNPFGGTPFPGGTFSPPVPGIYRITATLKTGNYSAAYNAAAQIVDNNGLTLAFDQKPASSWGYVWGTTLTADVPMQQGVTASVQMIADTGGISVNGSTIQGWPNAGIVTFTLLGTQT